MENFKEIAEKCLNGELSGTFVCVIGKTTNGKIVNVPSKRLQKLINFWPYIFVLNYSDKEVSYDRYDRFGMSKYGNCEVINFIPDMKENDKRTIQVSLQQAREWYNSGNDTLKTLALSSFSKEEIDPYPRSWSEYLKNHPGNLVHAVAPGNLGNKLTVYGALLTLREEWIHIWSQKCGYKEDWNHYVGNAICLDTNRHLFVTHGLSTTPLRFPTRELAVDFKNTFKNLLEQAKDLY